MYFPSLTHTNKLPTKSSSVACLSGLSFHTPVVFLKQKQKMSS